MLQYKDDSITIIADDFRSDAINILNSVDIQSATGRWMTTERCKF